MSDDLDRMLAVAEEAAEAGSEVLQGWFRRQGLEIREKEKNDFVTRADKESEEAILGVIRRHFPDHDVLAEESGATAGRSDAADPTYRWIVDPLDGTSNFLHGLPVFCVSVACCRGWEPVVGVILDPVKGDRFTARLGGGASWNGKPMSVAQKPGLDGAFLATGFPFRAKPALDAYLELFRDVFQQARGIRRCGAAALDLAFTAAGVFDGFFEFRLSPWDLAAGILLVTEAGGTVSDLDGGGNMLSSGSVLAGGEALHGELLRRVAASGVSEAGIRELMG